MIVSCNFRFRRIIVPFLQCIREMHFSCSLRALNILFTHLTFVWTHTHSFLCKKVSVFCLFGRFQMLLLLIGIIVAYLTPKHLFLQINCLFPCYSHIHHIGNRFFCCCAHLLWSIFAACIRIHSHTKHTFHIHFMSLMLSQFNYTCIFYIFLSVQISRCVQICVWAQ